MSGIAVTGQPDIDQATAEIAVALRDADPGKREQSYYDEAARLRDAIMAGTRALAEPAKAATDKVRGGYTYQQLDAAWELVRPVGNWKGPIKASVPGSTDVMAIHAAVEFFTGGEATIVSDEKTGALHVTAPGYYACIGS